MKKVFNIIGKTTKIFMIIASVLLLKSVNSYSHNDKIYNEGYNKTIDLTAMAVKLNEIQLADKYFPLDTFTGDLTGYSADCPLCSGYLACNGQYVKYGSTSYIDEDYGEVRIVASSKNLSCGSIVTFEASYISNEPVIAIVLDRGVLGTDLDLLVESESYARQNIGRHKTTYDVLRNGWSR